MSKRPLLFGLVASLVATPLLSVPAAEAHEAAPERLMHMPPPPPPPFFSPLMMLIQAPGDVLCRLKLTPPQEALLEKAESAQVMLMATGPYQQRKRMESILAGLADSTAPVAGVLRQAGQQRQAELKSQREAEDLGLAFLDSLDERQSNLVRGFMLNRLEMADPMAMPMANRPMPPSVFEDERGRPMR
ncbi:MAG: hypothetical protein PHD37_15705 [Gallionellaceae bacterium]|nr:hypothetical protein [Gallionellaceae bacterium]